MCLIPEVWSGFLVHFESEVLKRAHKNFSFVNGRCDLALIEGNVVEQRKQHRELLPVRRTDFLPLAALSHFPVLLHNQQPSKHHQHRHPSAAYPNYTGQHHPRHRNKSHRDNRSGTSQASVLWVQPH